MSDENLRPVHGADLGVPIRRPRKVIENLGHEAHQKRVNASIKLDNLRRENDRKAKELAAEDKEQKIVDIKQSTPIVFLGIKDGSAAYTQERHATALQEKIGHEDAIVIEADQSFVVKCPIDQKPEGHAPITDFESFLIAAEEADRKIEPLDEEAAAENIEQMNQEAATSDEAAAPAELEPVDTGNAPEVTGVIKDSDANTDTPDSENAEESSTEAEETTDTDSDKE